MIQLAFGGAAMNEPQGAPSPAGLAEDVPPGFGQGEG
jgi:hypothetical protein